MDPAEPLPNPLPGPDSRPIPLEQTPTDAPARRRVVAIAEVLLCSSVPTQILFSAILAQAGWVPDPRSLSFVLAVSLLDAAVVIWLMVVLTRAHGESVGALWLGSRSIVRETMLGLTLVPLVFISVVVLLNLMRLYAPWLHNVPSNPLEELASGGPGNAAMFLVVAIVAGGVREELQRAFILRRFEQHLGGTVVGVVVLSVAFGLGHYVQGWDAAVATGALGAFWAVVYVRRRSAIAPIVSHAGFNALEILRVAAMSA
jgi:uncharacterized protein